MINSVHESLASLQRVATKYVLELRRLREQNLVLSDRAEKAGLEVERMTTEARQFMWLGHGHSGQYGDDGEMQCDMCSKFGCVDYKREPLEKVKETFRAAQMERMGVESFGEWWNRVGRMFMAGDDIHVQRVVMGVAERAWAAGRGNKP